MSWKSCIKEHLWSDLRYFVNEKSQSHYAYSFADAIVEQNDRFKEMESSLSEREAFVSALEDKLLEYKERLVSVFQKYAADRFILKLNY